MKIAQTSPTLSVIADQGQGHGATSASVCSSDNGVQIYEYRHA